MENLQNNILIARFMGVEIVERNHSPAVFMFENAMFPEYFYATHYNSYDTDWKYLIEVVEYIGNIQNFRFPDGIFKYLVDVVLDFTKGRTQISDAYNEDDFCVMKYKSDMIQNTYEAVIEFINWYNTIKL